MIDGAGSSLASGQVSGWGVPQNDSRGSYIQVTNTTVMDTVGLIVWKASGTLDNTFLEVFKEDASGGLAEVFSEDISSSITTITSYFETTITGGLIVQAGERYLIRVRNSSSVATSVFLMGLANIATVSPDIGFLTVGSTDTVKTSYTAADAATQRGNSNSITWLLLAAKSLPQTDTSLADDFNRATLGGLWLPMQTTASQLDIANGQCAFQGTSAGTQAAVFIHATNGDDMRVDGILSNTLLATNGGGLLLCAKADMSQVVHLAVTAAGAKLYTGAWNSLTLQANQANVGNDGTWSLYYTSSTNTFTVLLNGATIFTWVDSSHVVSHGADYRFGGILIDGAAAVGGEFSPVIDNWNLRDWTP